MRRLLVGLSCVGLAVAGTQVAHAFAYRLVEPSADQRAHVLAGTGHAYLQHATLGLALVAVLAGLALLAEVRAAASGAGALAPRLWMFGAVAPALFVVQEHLERWFHDGVFPWTAAVEVTFVVGLLLQVPFALAAYALARLVLGVTHALVRLLSRRPQPRLGTRSVWPRLAARLPFSSHSQLGLGPRGPPLLSG